MNVEFKKFLEYQLRMHSLLARNTKDASRARHFAHQCFVIARQLGFEV